MTLWEGDDRSFDGSETVFQMRFGHAAESFGTVDIYLDAAGVAPVLGAQDATLAFGETEPAVDLPAGDYVLIVTAEGDPNDVLFESSSITFSAQTRILVTLFDGDENDVHPLAVQSFNAFGGVTAITDANALPTIRFIQTSLDLPLADIYDDAALTTPIVTDHAFGDVTGDLETPVGEKTITYTAAGDIGVSLFTTEFTSGAGRRIDFFLVGQMDDLASLPFLSDRRSISTEARVTVFHGSSNHDRVDIYVVDSGEPIDDALPRRPGVVYPLRTSGITLTAGEYDLYVTPFGEKTILAGPFSITVALGDVIETMVLDTVDPATAEIRLITAP